jgi:hypothetical protein
LPIERGRVCGTPAAQGTSRRRVAEIRPRPMPSARSSYFR